MIPRYEVKEVSKIWSEENKYSTFLKVELELLKTLEAHKKIPKGIAQEIGSKAKIFPARIDEIENEVRHDIIAFCTSITEQFSPEVGKYFHFGATSSDIIDTAHSLMIKDSLQLVLTELKECLNTLHQLAVTHKNLITIGRSHGMYAEPMSFGQKILGHYAEFKRRYDDLQLFFKNELTGKLSGAVGNYTILNCAIEKETLARLGLEVETVSTQIVPRDRLAKLILLHALLGQAIERISVEFRHLHRSELEEVVEGRVATQKGSSTMPHKKNPIAFENLTGMARVLKSHVAMALDNIVLWHERDISHSSTERLYLPDNFGIIVYALKRLTKTLQSLTINTEKIEARVHSTSQYLSSYFLHQLILNIPEMSREQGYKIVQKSSFQSRNLEQFLEHLKVNLNEEFPNLKELKNLEFFKVNDVEDLFLNQVQHVFARVPF